MEMKSSCCVISSLFWILISTSECFIYAFHYDNPLPNRNRIPLHLFMTQEGNQPNSDQKQPENTLTRRRLLLSPNVILPSLTFLTSLRPVNPAPSQAFEGGVGGLGKTKPSTGVVFRDPDSSQSAFSTSDSDFSNELVAPDGTPTLVSFRAPWPLLRSSSSIESRSISNPDSAFVLVAPYSSSSTSTKGDETVFTKKFFVDNVFGPAGKFGAYGAPSDVKIKTISSNLYAATFTTLTPSMRESERKAYISTSAQGGGVFMLVTGSTAVRFSNTEKTMKEVADSFRVVPAPKTSLR